MDIRHYFQDLLLVIFLINFNSGLTLSSIDDDYEDGPSFGRCPWIRNKLKNGRVRYRYKGRVAKFLCDSGYDLAGKRSSTCVRGQWSNPVPVCVARGCSRVPSIPNGHVTEMYRGALLVYDCNPGYSLDGSATIHCDGRRWSTSPPQCHVATNSPEVACDFESPDLCGWNHDPNHDFDWKRNQFSTPSGHAGTGPSFDHTFGEGKGGYYLYIEASSPRKINDTTRLFSPVYFADTSGGCFLFWYHMYGATTGGLRVYIKPESHVFDELSPKWELFGNQGDKWNRGNLSVPALHEKFQIVIEGIRGESYVGDSAIDDVYLTAQDCDSMANETGIVEHTLADSCRGRCRETVQGSSCSCKDNCYASHNCCSDYNSFCFEANDTIAHGTDEILPEDNPISKTSPITLAGTVTTISDTENHSLSSSPAAKSSTELSDVFTPSTTLETSTLLNSSISTNSTSLIPSNTTSDISSLTNITIPRVHTVTGEYLQTTIGTSSATIPSTAKSVPTVKSSSTSTHLPKSSISSTTSVAPTKIPTTSVAPTAISTTSVAPTAISTKSVAQTAISTTSVVPTTISTTLKSSITATASTTTSARVPVPGTTATSSGASSGTTILSTNPERNTAILTSANTTPPATVPITAFTSITRTSMVANISSQISIINSTLLHTSTAVESTTPPSISTPATSSVTATPSTRKTYNLRPRLPRTTTPVYSTTYVYNTTVSVNQIQTSTTLLPKTSAESSTTTPKNNLSTFPEVKSSTMYTTTWKTASTTTIPIVSSPRFRTRSTTISTTKVPSITSTSSQYIKKTTIQYTPHIFRFTSTPTSTRLPVTSEMGTSKAQTTASNGSVPIVISVLVVIVCIAGGVAYYLKKGRNKRQSKLSDDSEMRFLEENDYMEYSDASVLDRILIK